MAEKKKGFDLAAALGKVSNLDIGMEAREQIGYHHIEHLIPDERNFYELSDIEELAANIELVGLQQPLRVRPGEEEGSWVIVSGHRRHAALKQLVGESQELYERFCQVPCIVESQRGATDEVEGWLQELKLIYGNSNTRTLSSADLSRQAERVEMLLYQLKEAGVEFPGKMRDHVAKACKVSASKLARLKVIRDRLIPSLKQVWEAGDMNEAVAYSCAQYPAERQEQLIAYSKNCRYSQNPSDWNGAHVRDRMRTLDLEAALLCKKECSTSDRCDNSKRLARLAQGGGDWEDHCRTGKCCSGCVSISTCKNACPHLTSEIEKARKAREKEKDKRAAEEAERKQQKKESELRRKEGIRKSWIRFGEALKRANMRISDLRIFSDYWDDDDFEMAEKSMKGLDVSKECYPYENYPLEDVPYEDILGVADALGVSLDYLFCRTDEPGVAAAPGGVPDMAKPQWIPDNQRPKEYGTYFCKIDLGGKTMILRGIYDTSGARWLHPADGEPILSPVLGWYPIPKDGEDEKNG